MNLENSFIFDYELGSLAVLTGLCDLILWILIVLARKILTG